jgi:hypothetical protein
MLMCTDRSRASRNVHWNVPRLVNSLFTGRTQLLTKIEGALHHSNAIDTGQQKRFVITGLGGQGKSEICLKIADLLRQECVTPVISHLGYDLC